MSTIETHGGMLNAYTTKEHTCYYAWSRPKFLEESLAILSDLVFHPTFSDRDIKREKGVIIEEIRGLEDEADEMLFDLFEKELFSPATLALPVIGSEKSISSLRKNDITKFHNQYYSPDNVVAVFTGNLTDAEVKRLAKRYLHIRKTSSKKIDPVRTLSSNYAKRVVDWKAGLSQSHVIIGAASPGYDSPDLVAYSALVTLLGVGMSSRLNLRLREELGLAYECVAFHSPYADKGCIGVYAAVAEEKTEKALAEMKSILRGLFTKPITKAELERTKEQMIGSLLLSLESISNRMMRTGQSILYHNEYLTIAEEIRRVATLTLPKIRRIAEEIFRDEKRLSVVSIVPKKRLQSLKAKLI
jgi:predicted Zn-dependent peptidase